VEVEAGDQWLVNRILIRGYIFWRYLNCEVPNDAVAVYSNYRRYEDVRRRLAADGLIRIESSRRGVESLVLTKDGVRYVENLLLNGLEIPTVDLGSSREDPPVDFVKKLKPFRLLPTGIGSRDAERLFKALAMIYPDGFFKNGTVPEFLNQMSDDILNGRKVILRKMVDSFDTLYNIDDIDRDKRADFVEDVILGHQILEGLAEVSRIWRFYRFNPLALHTVVRFAALFELWSMGQKLKYLTAAIYGAVVYSVLTMLGPITAGTLAVAELVVFITGLVYLVLGVAAKLPWIRKTASKQEG